MFIKFSRVISRKDLVIIKIFFHKRRRFMLGITSTDENLISLTLVANKLQAKSTHNEKCNLNLFILCYISISNR